MTFKALPGVFDLVPENSNEPWKNSHIWDYVEGVFRELCREYGFQEIRTPLFEKTELFQRGVGETSDIVTKEMYTFEDRGGRSLTLRPEGTAPVIRAFLENQMSQLGSLHRLFYIASMFRYERSQAGRYRQHHQLGVEVIGSDAPETDAELIEMLYTLYQRLKIQNVSVNINSIGDNHSREEYRKALRNYLQEHFQDLSPDSQTRFEKNPLRILDSKDPKDQSIIAKAPQILHYLSEQDRTHFERVCEYLDLLKIPYVVNPLLVRGLDYYVGTVFEVVSSSLGSQNSLGGGGRYDGLIRELGGADLPSVGFGTGIERIIQTMIAQQVPFPKQPNTTLYLIPLGDEAKKLCIQLQKTLRDTHVSVLVDYSGKKLNKSLAQANQLKVHYTAILGEEEIKKGSIKLKNMVTGEENQVPLDSLPRILRVETQTDFYIDMIKEMSKPFAHVEESEFFIKKISKSINDTSLATMHLQEALKKMQGILDQPY